MQVGNPEREPTGDSTLPPDALSRVVLLDDALSGCATAAQAITAAVGSGLEAFGARAALIGLTDFRLRFEPVSASAGLERLSARCAGLALDAQLPIAEAVRTGRPVDVQPIPAEFLDGPSGSELGAERALAMPVVGARGVVGAIWLFLGPERPAFETELFASLVARLASAIDRTRLLESERRLRVRAEQSAARLSRLQSLTTGLSAALGAVDVADAVMTHAAAELGATGATCFMLADDETLRPVGSIGADTAAPSVISLANGDDLGAVLRRSAVVILPNGPGAPGTADDGTAPQAIVPLTIRGAILGAIELTFPPDREVDGELRSFLAVLGAQCAQAVERARLFEQRAREARVLQASLMPPALPEIPGLDIGAAYRPFGDGTVVGGDFYDVYALDAGRWGLVVGDVAGHGVEAAAITALARYTTRAAALLGSGPAEVLQILNRVMVSEALERFCTIVHGVLEPTATGVDVTLSIGGHPLPMLLERRTGDVTEVGASGTAVGLFPDPVLRETRLTLQHGDVLVFFTDGCVDVHTGDGTTSDVGVLMEVLREHAEADAKELTKRLEQAVIESNGGHNADDAALLVVRAQGDGR
jgi:serine phosphatase RsbU (regulator of sigma subunit)